MLPVQPPEPEMSYMGKSHRRSYVEASLKPDLRTLLV